MKVKLLHNTPLKVAYVAARTCYDSLDRSFPDSDEQLLRNIVAHGHTSVLEHVTYNLAISGISRGCLQQLVRHRHTAYSVESTRYTLKKKFKNNRLVDLYQSSGDITVDTLVEGQLNYIRNLILSEVNIPNDTIKYALPEAYKTDLIFSPNASGLLHFLTVRLDKTAHSEIRELAKLIYEALPKEHNFIYEGVV